MSAKQPDAIIADAEKALGIYRVGDFDRFDDLCTTEFWVALSRILLRELKKADRGVPS